MNTETEKTRIETLEETVRILRYFALLQNRISNEPFTPAEDREALVGEHDAMVRRLREL